MRQLVLPWNKSLWQYGLFFVSSAAVSCFFTVNILSASFMRQTPLLISRNGVEAGRASFRPNVPLFIVVKTTPDAAIRRSVMRETWLAQLGSSIPQAQYKFFSEEPPPSGVQTLDDEAHREGDMVILHDLLQKAHRQIGPKMIRSFEWVIQNYNILHAVMVDDDSYVNVDRLRSDWRTWEVCQ